MCCPFHSFLLSNNVHGCPIFWLALIDSNTLTIGLRRNSRVASDPRRENCRRACFLVFTTSLCMNRFGYLFPWLMKLLNEMELSLNNSMLHCFKPSFKNFSNNDKHTEFLHFFFLIFSCWIEGVWEWKRRYGP